MKVLTIIFGLALGLCNVAYGVAVHFDHNKVTTYCGDDACRCRLPH
jgi:hypothetical protein